MTPRAVLEPMKHLVLLPAASLALAFSGCETPDLAGTGAPVGADKPSVVVKPVCQVSKLGLARSGETFSGITSWYSVRTNGGTAWVAPDTGTLPVPAQPVQTHCVLACATAALATHANVVPYG